MSKITGGFEIRLGRRSGVACSGLVCLLGEVLDLCDTGSADAASKVCETSSTDAASELFEF